MHDIIVYFIIVIQLRLRRIRQAPIAAAVAAAA
jgi:hypothetical protein